MAADTPHQILIVEDNDDSREALVVVLDLAGFAVAPAWGVEDALRQMRQGFRPCVVLLDLHMPTLDGWDFLDRMRVEPHLADVPAVILSGDLDQRRRVHEAGWAFLGKPVAASTVVAAVARHCRRQNGSRAQQ